MAHFSIERQLTLTNYSEISGRRGAVDWSSSKVVATQRLYRTIGGASLSLLG